MQRNTLTTNIALLFVVAGCLTPGCSSAPYDIATTEASDPTLTKYVAPRDRLEQLALERGADLRLVDDLVNERTPVPEFSRAPLAEQPAEALIAANVPLLDDATPFPGEEPLEDKDVTIRVGISRSTFRTRTPNEVLSAVQPFIDLVQRQVNVRGTAVLNEAAAEGYYGLLDGAQQMAICHVFDYLMIRSWFEDSADNGTVLLARALPANPRTGELDREFAGTPGTSIELVVAAKSEFKDFSSLRGARLALVADYVHGPGTFLTASLRALGHPADEPFFGRVTLRRYAKDAVLDVLKGKADVACVDQGTVGALHEFYGIKEQLRPLAVSPRFNMDVLFTTLNNIETHRTEIELTQTQLTTLDKDAEGQEVLFFFDTAGWVNHRDGDIDVPLASLQDYLAFVDDTPVDLKPLLDPTAAVDQSTYDRLGDE